MTFRHIVYLEKFKKDLKKLLKKFPSLEEDLESLIRAQLVAYHKHNIDNHGIFPVEDIKILSPKIFKVKKFACKSLKGYGVRSGIRVIYAYFLDDDRIELIEIYFKREQVNEDKERIKSYYV